MPDTARQFQDGYHMYFCLQVPLRTDQSYHTHTPAFMHDRYLAIVQMCLACPRTSNLTSHMSHQLQNKDYTQFQISQNDPWFKSTPLNFFCDYFWPGKERNLKTYVQEGIVIQKKVKKLKAEAYELILLGGIRCLNFCSLKLYQSSFINSLLVKSMSSLQNTIQTNCGISAHSTRKSNLYSSTWNHLLLTKKTQ